MEELHLGFTLLWIVVILVTAKLAGLIERVGQPAVLGELVVGVVLGNLALVGFGMFEPIKENEFIAFLAELGVLVLLFQVGLESNINEMRKVGGRALLVAIIGVVAPFTLGTYVVGPWLLPGLSNNAYIFLGATLTATSVGITARVFRDLGVLQSKEARIVLGAAVIDDVLGLIILAVVSAIVTVGAVSVGGVVWITAKALLFLVGAIVIGIFVAPFIGRGFSRIHTGIGMKFTLAASTALFFAFIAQQIGLAPIVGAFAAGLVLDAVHFKDFEDSSLIAELRNVVRNSTSELKNKVQSVIDRHADHHVEELIEPLSYFLVPIFFVVTGMHVNLEVLLDPSIVLVALGVTVIAFIGKVIAGLVAGNVNKQIVGWGMVPRGEVGLIFAATGQSLGVVSEEVFAVIVIMVIVTTLLTPPMLTFLIRRSNAAKDKQPVLSGEGV